jgi:hypothetical protein
MKMSSVCVAIAIAFGATVGGAPAPASRDAGIVRLDPALDAIVSADAKLETLGEHYSTTGAGPGEVGITSPEGRMLGTIQLPDLPGEPRRQVCATNVGFGDPDAKGLSITACNLLFRVRLNMPGIRPGPTP